MGWHVLKFGGSALVDGNAISTACERILSCEGERIAVVVSALHGVTDQLLADCQTAQKGIPVGDTIRIRHRTVCRQLGLSSDSLDRLWRELQGLLAQIQTSRHASSQTRDQVLSFGERASARIVAQALREAGALATPVDAFDLGFETDSSGGLSRLAPGVKQRIGPALEQVPGIPVVTGFLAKDVTGYLTTLGRDGSDWTAAIVAQATRATELVFWKDVPGVLSADPSWIEVPRTLPYISYAEAQELAFQGSPVLHHSAMVRQGGGFDADPQPMPFTRVRIRCFGNPDLPGTEVRPSTTRDCAMAVAGHPKLIGIGYSGDSATRTQAKLSAALIRLGRSQKAARVISQSGQGASLWFEECEALDELLAEVPPPSMVLRDQASVAVVGERLGQHPGLFRLAFEQLELAGVAVDLAHFGGRDHGQTFLVPRDQLGLALQTLHDSVLGVPLSPGLNP